VSIRFLADADLNNGIVHGVRRRELSIEFRSARNASLRGLPDDKVLELAAAEGRVLVSHDKRTMPTHFAARIRSGQRSPGLLLALPRATIGEIVESLLIIWSSSHEEESAESDSLFAVPQRARVSLAPASDASSRSNPRSYSTVTFFAKFRG